MSYIYFLAVALLAALRQVVKNPAHKAQLRDVLLRIRDAISFIYEPEQLQGSVNARVNIGSFINKGVEMHSLRATAGQYVSGTFDLDDDGETPEPHNADAGATQNVST